MQVQQEQEIMAMYFEYVSTEDENYFEDAFCGIYRSEDDYAYELADELYLHDAPEFIQRYFDYDAFCRDLFLTDCFSIELENGNVAIFRNI